ACNSYKTYTNKLSKVVTTNKKVPGNRVNQINENKYSVKKKRNESVGSEYQNDIINNNNYESPVRKFNKNKNPYKEPSLSRSISPIDSSKGDINNPYFKSNYKTTRNKVVIDISKIKDQD